MTETEKDNKLPPTKLPEGDKAGDKAVAQASQPPAAEPPPPPAPPAPPVTHTSVNAVDKVLGFVIEELQKRFDDKVPVSVLKFLVPTIAGLTQVGELDTRARMQMQSRIDDGLRKLGMI